ncbi:Aste57867_11076 [Aphanomyces stellatus]|uniref:Aste57867_11076 protein n=1 Tax=Aphanomyces stellatus TaxID=120398 RepID=A0A485KSI4_9STRA|nr:hypothetical protein As57867_011034 [Aphanomyces stellatus]VFT87943.1 Aste57867_11076 [Aphanomyces stellatus]
MAACRYRVSKLRGEIERERKRQTRLEDTLEKKIDTFESCKFSPTTRSIIQVRATAANNTDEQQEAPDWGTMYELDRGDWDASVHVHICRYRGEDMPVESDEAARHIARWYREKRSSRAPSSPTTTKASKEPVRRPSYVVATVDPRELLARLAHQIEEKAHGQKQSRAAFVLQRFFTHILDNHPTNPANADAHKSQRMMARRQARKRLAQDQLKLVKAARMIQAAYRGSMARRRFTWKESIVKANFMRLLLLEAEWAARPSPAVLLHMAAAYWTYSRDAISYTPAERARLVRIHLVCAMKALAYGWTPDAAERGTWWLQHGRRCFAMWEESRDTAMLQQALTALEQALAVDDCDPEVWFDVCRIQTGLGLHCQVVRTCRNAFALEMLTDPAKKQTLRLLEAQSHFHLTDFDAAAALLTAALDASTTTYYSTLDLWLFLGRCHHHAHHDDVALAYYDKVLTSLYAPDDIVRRDLTPQQLLHDATLHLSVGAKCAKARHVPLALDLLEHGLRCDPFAASGSHKALLAQCRAATLDGCCRAALDEQKRLPVGRLRAHLRVVL